MSDGLKYLLAPRTLVNLVRWSAWMLALGFGLTLGVTFGNFVTSLLLR